MLLPRRVKHRRVFRGRRTGFAKGGTRVSFGEYGLKALEEGWITSRQIEAARIAMTRKIRRGGKVWINIFPDKPVTSWKRRLNSSCFDSASRLSSSSSSSSRSSAILAFAITAPRRGSRTWL